MTDMPFDPTMTDPSGATQPSEEELRAAYEAELKSLRIEDVMMQTVVSLLNLGARRAGLLPGSEDEVDPEQVRMAIEGARGLLGPLEPVLGPNAGPLKDALSQLQLAYTKLAGGPAAPGPGPEGEAPQGDPAAGSQDPDGPGPAQQSGRLWVPGR